MPETKLREIKPLVDTEDEIALVERMKAGREKITRELRKVIVGQDDVIQEVLIALFAGGHSSDNRCSRTGQDPPHQDDCRYYSAQLRQNSIYP